MIQRFPISSDDAGETLPEWQGIVLMPKLG